jgi:predicted transcriptional regulator
MDHHSGEAIPFERVLELNVTSGNVKQLELVTKALGSDTRLEILRFLGTHTSTLLEIAESLNLPQSTATLHINILEKAGLVETNLQPARRGLQKIIARVYDRVVIQLPAEPKVEVLPIEVSMPVGAYVDAVVTPTCGLAGEVGIIGLLDDPLTFYEPQRVYAQLLWFHRGYVEYRFPNRLPTDALLDVMELSFEVCSEAPLHHLDWPSDITVWINSVEIGTWTSPADFGGERGRLTPHWWDSTNSQYGLMKVWKITEQGSFVDGVKVSGITLDHLNLEPGKLLSVRIGIKDDAHNIGGINLFGAKFGNYPQDIILKQHYRRAPKR